MSTARPTTEKVDDDRPSTITASTATTTSPPTNASIRAGLTRVPDPDSSVAWDDRFVARSEGGRRGICQLRRRLCGSEQTPRRRQGRWTHRRRRRVRPPWSRVIRPSVDKPERRRQRREVARDRAFVGLCRCWLQPGVDRQLAGTTRRAMERPRARTAPGRHPDGTRSQPRCASSADAHPRASAPATAVLRACLAVPPHVLHVFPFRPLHTGQLTTL